ncbi:MAG TPA: alcohol dehydrogenase catalytic domain-containing protein [Candidatus Nitrosotenuis sp.]|jgi:threonine dehydrogenase-like Zn-dependent dehydrogenase
MKALYFDGKTLTMNPSYPKPKPGETLVKVTMAGICGTDLEILKGYMSYSGVLGHEFVGIVEDSHDKGLIGKRIVGEINAGCKKCESCFSGMERHCQNRTVLGIYKRDGAFAEYVSLPEENIHVIPDSISDMQAVFVEPLAAAFEIIEQLHLESSWKIAILGDGRLAQLVARVLNLSCRDITCFGHHERKTRLLQKIGIKTKTAIENSDEHSYDVVVEATGSESGFLDTIKLVRPRGIVILKSTIASQNKIDLSPAIINEITFVGSRCGPFRPAITALATGLISVDDLIDAVYPIDRYAEAFEHAGKSGTLKIMLES